MFGFLKKKKNNGAESSDHKNSRNEKYIISVMEKTGLSREHAEKQIRDARKRLGITYRDYDRYDFYNIPVTDQEVEYRKICERKERRKQQKESCIKDAAERMGWSVQYAEDQIQDARNRLGISYRDYERYDFCNIPVENQEHIYEQIVSSKEQDKADKAAQKEKTRSECYAAIMEHTGWSLEKTKAKIEIAKEKSGAGYKDYLFYQLWNVDEDKLCEYFTQGVSRKLIEKYDTDKSIGSMLRDKCEFDRRFEVYLGRPWASVKKVSRDEFREKFCNEKKIIYKPISGNRGIGIEVFDIDSSNIDDVYEKIVKLPLGVVEGFVVQHPEIRALSEKSVNTIRIVSLFNRKYGDMEIAYAGIRIGGGESVVDNFHSGGIVAGIDLDTGKVITDGIDLSCNIYKTTSTGVPVKGFMIPYFSEALDMVKEAGKDLEGYLGWDVAISENGPVLIEANTMPGAVILQMPYIPEKRGMKYVMEKYL